MKEIRLANGLYTMVDDEDYEKVSAFKWHTQITNHVVGRPFGTKQKTPLHRYLLNPPANMTVDHIDRNPLNNQKFNLRICTQKENARNSTVRKHTSRYKGVRRLKKSNRWTAQIMVNYKSIYLGSFINEVDAAETYNSAALKYFGEFALINEIN